MTTLYGDITPRTAAYAAKELLKRAFPFLQFEKFGQSRPLPARTVKVIKFRRFEALDSTPNALTEGVTPSAKNLTVTDVTATIAQYGDRVIISDVVQDTHEDPVLREAIDILGEQAAIMVEKVRFAILKAGSNVFYSNGSARSSVNTPITLNLQRKVTRALKQQNARPITTVIKSSPNYGTDAVAPAFVAICHPDLEADIRNLAGFTPTERYGSFAPWEGEIGKVEDVRYVTSTVVVPWADAGGAYAGSGTSMVSTSGTSADVYPVLFIGRDAYGLIPLKGKESITPMVVNPQPSDSDPLAQRGHVGWKTYTTAAILNDLWMARCEVSVTAL